MPRFLGGLLLGLGILIAGLSGLCTLVFFVTELSVTFSGTVDMIPAFLMFGGIPFAIGVALFLLGRHLLKTKDQV